MSGKDMGGLTIHGATKASTAHGDVAAERARRFVAVSSSDVYDRARLLEMLGLVPAGMRLTVEVS